MPILDASLRHYRKKSQIWLRSNQIFFEYMDNSLQLSPTFVTITARKIKYFFFFTFLLCVKFIKINNKSCKGATGIFSIPYD